MGIHDRDYMRRRRPTEPDYDSPVGADSKVEALLGGFLRRNPGFLKYAGIALGILLLVALLVAVFYPAHH
jgi:hypothetical protein